MAQSGLLWSWGWNAYSQLGDGTTTDQHSPVRVINLDNAVQVSAGQGHTIALKSDGTVWAWGKNVVGALGDGTTTNRTQPIRVKGLSNVVYIAAGDYHSLAVKRDGTAWGWGANGYGQLADGTTIDRLLPVQAVGMSGVVQLATGYVHTLALKSDGTVWGWGWRGEGRLGDGIEEYTVKTTPVQAKGLTNVIQISAGRNHSLALTADGHAWAWGWNQRGQLGDGTGTNRSLPTSVSSIDNIVQLAGSYQHSLALKSDGTVWAWGWQADGRLGNGVDSQQAMPTPIQTLKLATVTQISAGYEHSLAVLADGTVWAWGRNDNGNLGIGNTSSKKSPSQVRTVAGQNLTVGGYYYSFSLQTPVQATSLTVLNPTLGYGAVVTLTAQLKSSPLGGVLISKPVTLSLDGVALVTANTAASGKISVVAPNPLSMSLGTHSITAAFAGDALHTASNGAGTLTIVKADTLMTVGTFSGIPGSTKSLTAILKRKTDKAHLSARTLTFKIDGNGIGTAETDGTGTASLPYTFDTTYTAGSHVLAVEYAGDDLHNAGMGTGTLVVSKLSTLAIVANSTGIIGKTVNVSAILKSGKNALVGRTLTFKVDGSKVGVGETDVNGRAVLAYKLDDALGTGAHTLTAEFAGEDFYSDTVGSATLTVNQASTKLAIVSVKGKVGTNVSLVATLTRLTDKGLLDGKTIRFQIDGADVGTATTSAGVATLTYTLPNTLTVGTHTLTAVFDGDINYLTSTSAVSKLVVQP